MGDKPISKQEILKKYYITKEELDFIYDKVYKLFDFGQEIASKLDLFW